MRLPLRYKNARFAESRLIACRTCSSSQVRDDPTRGLPLRFQTCRLDNFEVSRNPKMGDALTACHELLNPEHKRSSVFLLGDPGLGKTHLLVATIIAARESGTDARFWEVPELLAHLRSTFDKSTDGDVRDRTLEGEIDMFCSPSFLLGLDDFGAHNTKSDWAEEQLFRILNRRYTSFAPTMITTNVPPSRIDPRIKSRFRDGFVYCTGKDVRGR